MASGYPSIPETQEPTTPEPDPPTTEPERMEWGPDRPGPKSERMESGPDRPGPKSERMEWGPDRPGPKSERMESGPDRPGPKSERMESGPDRPRPRSEIMESGPDRPWPRSERMESGPDRPGPKPEAGPGPRPGPEPERRRASASSSEPDAHISDMELPPEPEPHPSSQFCVPRQDHLYKVLVVGEFGVGKTSIIRRYTEDIFSGNYKVTIGVDFALKVTSWDARTRVSLQLWDIAGHERFGHMTSVYYKHAIGAVVVCDLTRPGTLDAVTKWLGDLHSKVTLTEDMPIPVLLFANKCDVEGVEIDTQMMNEFCRLNGLLTWFPTSARENINIEEGMDYLTHHIMALTMAEDPELRDQMSLHMSSRRFKDIRVSAIDPDTKPSGYGCCRR